MKLPKGADVGAATRSPRKRRRRFVYALGACFAIAAIALWVAFPGPRLAMAFTLGSGVGTAGLQARIDALEEQAIGARSFSADDRAFLSREHSLFVDNGLGEYLVQLGLAKSFLAFAEWDE